MTVLIHGTVGLRPSLSLSTCIKLICDDIENSEYKKIVETIREDPFFFESQPMQERGLRKTPSKRANAASCYAKLMQQLYYQHETNLYYTFGWSGLLSHTQRCKETKELYQALYQEVERIRELYPDHQVHLRLIGYSHGGTIGLLLGSVYDEKRPLRIDELILLAMPVQKETEHLVHHAIFTKIYHFYSRKDSIQKMDCFSLNRFFSRRCFSKSKRKPLPEKLTQVEVKIKVKKYEHARGFPIDCSPHHSEFWFFGWTPTCYRPTFALYPLPVAPLIPSIIELIEQFMPEHHHLVVELYPQAAHARLRKRHSKHHMKVPWLSCDQLRELKLTADSCCPDGLSWAAHEAHIASAIRSATGATVPRARKGSASGPLGVYLGPEC